MKAGDETLGSIALRSEVAQLSFHVFHESRRLISRHIRVVVHDEVDDDDPDHDAVDDGDLRAALTQIRVMILSLRPRLSANGPPRIEPPLTSLQTSAAARRRADGSSPVRTAWAARLSPEATPAALSRECDEGSERVR
jgi:hypothetical protein